MKTTSTKQDGVEIFLNSIYDKMIIWNSSGNAHKMPLWVFLKLSPKDYISFSNNPEEWASAYVEGWGVE